MRIERTRARSADAGRSRGGTVAMRAALGAHLTQRGLKHSRQRELVAEVFFGAGGHVAVEELIQRVRGEDPRVSVATVYRTMKLLAECGLAVPRQFDGGQTRYEPGVGRAHHDHLICTACGEIAEFADQRIEALQARVAERHGFEVETHKLELYGRCTRCRRTPRAEGAHP